MYLNKVALKISKWGISDTFPFHCSSPMTNTEGRRVHTPVLQGAPASYLSRAPCSLLSAAMYKGVASDFRSLGFSQEMEKQIL